LLTSLRQRETQRARAIRPHHPPLDALRGLFDTLPDVQAWIKDAQRRYLWVNRTFLLNYGMHQLTEVLGKTDDDLSPPHLAAHFREGDEAVLAGHTVQGRLELVGRFRPHRVVVLHHQTACASMPKAAPSAPPASRACWMPRRSISAATSARRHHCPDDTPPGESVTNAEMARTAGMSARAFERSFQREYGLPPQQYLKRLRIQTACRLLVDTRESIAAIAQRCGFADQSHLTREFRRVTGYHAGGLPRSVHAILMHARTHGRVPIRASELFRAFRVFGASAAIVPSPAASRSSLPFWKPDSLGAP
jgi:AraC-like DNA-binding protein